MNAVFLMPGDAKQAETLTPIHICRPDAVKALSAQFTPAQQAFLAANQFEGAAGQMLILPDTNGGIAGILYGAGEAESTFNNSALRAGDLSARLQPGDYKIAAAPQDWPAPLIAQAWGMGAYKFTKYLNDTPAPPRLLLTDNMQPAETQALVSALWLGRDLINTPAGDMGPAALHGAAKALATRHGAKLSAVVGEDLLAQNYPMIHAVGRAAHEPPRLVHLEWGPADAPHLALVGKGITFDSGGLNMKGASGMRIMKKDMGGAAHALALADAIMAANLPLRLSVFLAIAENAVSASSFRPGDVLPSRAGLSVEIDNTDAEGRLVLGDALCRAGEDHPDLIIDFATLTGAARVALGPTLPPFFSNHAGPVESLLRAGDTQLDPFWHMPLWQPYMKMLGSPIADMKNAGGGFAGAVTAALFLEKFAGNHPWMHFDVYGWNPSTSPARPKGGEIMTVRAIFHWLKAGGLKRR